MPVSRSPQLGRVAPLLLAVVQTACLSKPAPGGVAGVQRVPIGAPATTLAFDVTPTPSGFSAVHPVLDLAASFDRGGARFGPSRAPHSVVLAGETGIAPEAIGEEVRYRGSGSSVWYRQNRAGWEQGIDIPARPWGGGPLTLPFTVRVDGAMATPRLEPDGQSAELAAFGGWRLLYRDARAHDARGRSLPVRLESGPGALSLVVDDVGAEYPVAVDPLIVTETDVGNVVFTTFVAVSGDTLAIGNVEASISTGSGAVNAGDVELWSWTDGGWTQGATLKPGDAQAGERFGSAMAMDDSTLVVAAPYYTSKNNTTGQANGALYFYAWDADAGSWDFEQELFGDDGAFVASGLSLDGTTLAAGAGLSSSSHQLEEGEVDVYTEANGTWSLQQQIYPSDVTANEPAYFGAGVALTGNLLAVGAPAHTFGTTTKVGTLYVFGQSGGVWSQLQEFDDPAFTQGDDFGFSVATDGNNVAVGAFGTSAFSAGAGAVYVYPIAGGQLSDSPQLLGPSDPSSGGRFGATVAFGGGSLAVGACMPNSENNYTSGKAGTCTSYVFQLSGANWEQVVELGDPDGGVGIGESLAVGSDWLVSGSDDLNGVGAAPTASAYYFSWVEDGGVGVGPSGGGSGGSSSGGSSSGGATGGGSSGKGPGGGSSGGKPSGGPGGGSSGGGRSGGPGGGSSGGGPSGGPGGGSSGGGPSGGPGGGSSGGGPSGGPGGGSSGGGAGGSSSGVSCGGTSCAAGQVCCTAGGCANQCVPDCRLGGNCPSGLACDQSTGVCVPSGSGSSGAGSSGGPPGGSSGGPPGGSSGGPPGGSSGGPPGGPPGGSSGGPPSGSSGGPPGGSSGGAATSSRSPSSGSTAHGEASKSGSGGESAASSSGGGSSCGFRGASPGWLPLAVLALVLAPRRRRRRARGTAAP